MQRITSIYRKYSASPFVRNVSKLTGGTAIAQLISLVTAPVLYRMYSKEFYGTLGVFMAIAGVLGAVSSMQYIQAVIIEKEDHDAMQAMWLVRIINMSLTFISLIVVFFYGDIISAWLHNELLADWIILLPVSIFFSGQNELFRIWANRKGKFVIMTWNGLLIAVLVPVISISVGILHNDGPMGLFLGLLAGQIVPAIFMNWQLGKEYSFGLATLNMGEIGQIARKHRAFPTYSLPAEFINRFSNQMPTFMLSVFSGAGAVASFNLSVRMLSLPLQLISGAVGEVFRKRAVEDYQIFGSCRPIFVKTLKTLTILSIGPTVALLSFGPTLFVFFFGEQWKEAGIFSQVLAALYFMKFIASPLSYIFIIAQKQREDFLWHVWMLVSSFAAFYLGFYFFESSYAGLTIFAVNYIAIYFAYLIMTYQYSGGQGVGN